MRNWHDRNILRRDIPVLEATPHEQAIFMREEGEEFPRRKPVNFFEKFEELEVKSQTERNVAAQEKERKAKEWKESWEKSIIEKAEERRKRKEEAKDQSKS